MNKENKKLTIVYLDSWTLNPGDLSWEKLATLGTLKVYKHTYKEQLFERALEADIIITNKIKLHEKELVKLPKLKLIIVSATGYDVIDTKTARLKGITVCNAPDYSRESVAQHTFSLILFWMNQLAIHTEAVSKGEWKQSPYFCFWKKPIEELQDKTLGIIGYGAIGKRVAEIAQVFQMNILVHSRKSNSLIYRNVTYVSLDNLLSQSDIITLHCPLNLSTKGIINKSNIEKMKKTAFLINTSRGGLVVEHDLAEALNQERISGAALDVLSKEPPTEGNPLLESKNCFITPHIAWTSKTARSRLMDIIYENIQAFINSKPNNVVN